MRGYFQQDWKVICTTIKTIDSRVVYVMLLDALMFAASLAVIWAFGMIDPIQLQAQIASGQVDVLAIIVRGVGLLITVLLISSVIQVAIWRVIQREPLHKDIPYYLIGAIAGFIWILILLIVANFLPTSPFEWGSTKTGIGIVVSLLRQFLLIFFPLYYISILFSDFGKTRKMFRPIWTFIRVGILDAWMYPLFFGVSLVMFAAIIFISSVSSTISSTISIGVTFASLLVFAAWLRFYINERLKKNRHNGGET